MSQSPSDQRQVVTPLHPVHPVRVAGVQYGKDETNYHIGQRIGKLRYDQLIELLWGILDEIWEQFRRDEDRGRISLVRPAGQAIVYLRLTIVYLIKRYRSAKPYMKHDLDLHPESDFVNRNNDV